MNGSPELLGAARVRELAARLGLRPTKQWGQNFVVDANTVRRIVRLAGVGPDDVVVEVGPGLGSLTLALLPEVAHVTAVEVDPTLAAALPDTVAELQPTHTDRLTVVQADALHADRAARPAADRPRGQPPLQRLRARRADLPPAPADPSAGAGHGPARGGRAARRRPGSRTFGVPSLKAAWYADVRLAGTVPRSVFWPVPNVDSGLVAMVRRPPPVTTATREEVFRCIDAAFAQRRKTLRAALAGWAGGAPAAEALLRAAGVDPSARGEQLDIAAFAAIAAAKQPHGGELTLP